MKLFTYLFFTITFFSTTYGQGIYGIPPVSKISTELNKKQVTHSLEVWQLESEKGDNSIKLILEAVKYSALNSSDELKGIRVILHPTGSTIENETSKSLKEFIAFIDQSEYSDVMVVIKQMITNFAKKEESDKRGSTSYTTQTGIKFGFDYTKNKEAAFISLVYSQAEISCEFSDIDEFLNNFRGFINIAAKDLYLPENAEKLKKAKKSNQEAKDIIIDDI